MGKEGVLARARGLRDNNKVSDLERERTPSIIGRGCVRESVKFIY